MNLWRAVNLRSIQWRMVAIYVALIVLAMELTGLYVIRSLEQYYLANSNNTLYAQAQLASGFLSRYLAGKPDLGVVGGLVGDLGRQAGADIAVLDPSGTVLGASRPSLFPPGGIVKRDEITLAMAGSRGEASGTDPETGERRISVAVPVRSGGRVTGVVHISASQERIYQTLGDIKAILLTASLIALAMTAGAAWALARTITDPIREITSRAAEMAAGNFDRQIQIRSDDEVGQLGTMFNHLTLRLRETLGEISDEKAKMEAVLAYMADALLAVDPSGRVLLINPAAADMLGLNPEAVLGRPAGPVLFKMPGLEETLREVLRTKSPASGQFSPGSDPSRVYKGDLAPLKNREGRPVGVVAVFHDISELQKLDRLRREFVANVSHELKTPLTTIKSYVETLLDGAGEDTAIRDKFLSVVASETDRMARLVSDLLNLSQLDSGRVFMDIAPAEPLGVVENVLGKLRVQTERKKLRFETVLREPVPQVMADEDKLEQVLNNIISNAIDFSPEGGRVLIEVYPGSSGSPPEVVFRVRDEGIGIPPEDLPRIFERFYRVDKARSRALGGTGLGLSIAREIVRAHGGKISIESAPGAGTAVVFSVPAEPRGVSAKKAGDGL